MDAYIKISTMEYPRFIGDIQNEFPDWTENQPLPSDWNYLTYLAQPELQEYQICEVLQPEQQNDGTWIIKWGNIRDMTQEEIDLHNLSKMQQDNNNVSPALAPIQ